MECFIIVTVLWIFSVCIHEFGHAIVAYWGGDHTVKDKGYLTLNPIHYTDPVGSILLPVIFMIMGGIGLPGGAVYIERQLLRSKLWETAMSLAGPAMNYLMIIIIALCFKTGLVPTESGHLSSISLAFILQLQIMAVLFNMIPIPPLDGFQAIAPWMPEAPRARFYEFSRYSLILLYLVFWLIPPINDIFFFIVHIISHLLGVPPRLGWEGYVAFQFWKHGEI
jgi:Zn-dependent protease